MIERIGKSKFIGLLAFFAILFTIIPIEFFSLKAKAEETNVFEDGRFLKEEGDKYLRIMNVTKQGAEVLLYDKDSEISFYEYTPSEDNLIFDSYFAFATVPESFDDEDIPECISECLVFMTSGGPVSLYLSPDGRSCYLRDMTELYDGMLDGTYLYIPYVDSSTEIKVTEVPINVPVPTPPVAVEVYPSPTPPVIPSPIIINEITPRIDWRITQPPVEVTEVPWETPDEIVVETENWDEVTWIDSYEKLCECFYLRFEGVSWIEDAYVVDESAYKKYHNHERKPVADEVLCDPSVPDDLDKVNEARLNLFKNQKGKQFSNCELLFYADDVHDSNIGFTGIYVENGETVSATARLSTGKQAVEYFFQSIDWSRADNTGHDMFEVGPGYIRAKGDSSPEIVGDGGIADYLEYDIYIVPLEDGSIEAKGHVTVHGEGTEVLVYAIDAFATELQTDEEILEIEAFRKKRITEDCYYLTPGASGTDKYYTSPEPTVVEISGADVFSYITPGILSPGADGDPAVYITPGGTGEKTVIVEIPVECHPHHNDWPDDTDKEDRPEADSDTVYGYNSDEMTEADFIALMILFELMEDDNDGLSDNSGENSGNDDTAGEPVERADLSTMLDSHIMSIYASSELTESVGTHYADYMIDNDAKTAWVEGASGDGEGEYFTVKFDTEVELGGFIISNGYFKSSKLYDQNGKIDELLVEFDDGTFEKVELEDYSNSIINDSYSDMVIFEKYHKTKSVTFTIVSTYSGSKYSDTCVSEIGFLIK